MLEKTRTALATQARKRAAQLVEEGLAFTALDTSEGTPEERKFYRMQLLAIAQSLRAGRVACPECGSHTEGFSLG
jgi:hypothetical protein